jgi:hypothetical protein
MYQVSFLSPVSCPNLSSKTFLSIGWNQPCPTRWFVVFAQTLILTQKLIVFTTVFCAHQAGVQISRKYPAQISQHSIYNDTFTLVNPAPNKTRHRSVFSFGISSSNQTYICVGQILGIRGYTTVAFTLGPYRWRW